MNLLQVKIWLLVGPWWGCGIQSVDVGGDRGCRVSLHILCSARVASGQELPWLTPNGCFSHCGTNLVESWTVFWVYWQ